MESQTVLSKIVKKVENKELSKNIMLNVKKSNYYRQFVSAEHIYPQCLLNVKQSNDMHNIIKTLNTLNGNRSNYKFEEDYDLRDKNWLELECNNYVNHKDKIFVPNNDSRGIISRAILYMYKEYNCNPNKIISMVVRIRMAVSLKKLVITPLCKPHAKASSQ